MSPGEVVHKGVKSGRGQDVNCVSDDSNEVDRCEDLERTGREKEMWGVQNLGSSHRPSGVTPFPLLGLWPHRFITGKCAASSGLGGHAPWMSVCEH